MYQLDLPRCVWRYNIAMTIHQQITSDEASNIPHHEATPTRPRPNMALTFTSKYFYIGWLTIFTITIIEYYVWTANKGDSGFIKSIRFHVYAFAVIGLFFSCRYTWRALSPLLMRWYYPLNYVTCGLLLTMLSLVLLTVPLGQILVDTEPHTILLIGNFTTGIVLFFSLILLTINFTSKLLQLAYWSHEHINTDVRDLTRRLRVSLALLITLMISTYGLFRAHSLHTEFITIPIKGLSPRFNGTTIVQMSDLHLGAFIGRSRMEKIVAMVNGLHGDMVVVTGDLADSSVKKLWDATTPLKDVISKYGVYYSTGNHDYYTGDVDNWIRVLPELNVQPLINERDCPLSYDDKCALYVAGLEDIETRRIRYGHHSMDIHRALTGRVKATPTIVLAHQPRAAAEAIQWDDVRLVLSGHTHGGQILFMMLPVYLYNPFFAGLYQPLPDVSVYVSAGTNYYLLPYRHYRPEITHITLLSK